MKLTFLLLQQKAIFYFLKSIIFLKYIDTTLMPKFKIPGVSISWNRALGITQAKQKFARETGIPTSKAGLERKIGKMVLNAIFGKKR